MWDEWEDAAKDVKEAYVNDYNPYCLEAMRSNLAFELITHTPDKVTAYITKAKHRLRIS